VQIELRMKTLLLYAFKYSHLNAAFEVRCSLYSLLLSRLSVSCNFRRYLEISIANTIVYHWQCSEPAWSLGVLIINFPKTRLPPYHSLSSNKIPSNLWSEPPFVSLIHKEKEKAAFHNSKLSILFHVKLYYMLRSTRPLLDLSHVSVNWTHFKPYTCIL
jgi:hypothetical protein